MRQEYALEGVGFFKHWSDAYGRLGDARRYAKELVRNTSWSVYILRRETLPLGHEIGANWSIVGVVSESKIVLQNFSNGR